jgi:glycosyltransferase involved in cell wall biosynthesis
MPVITTDWLAIPEIVEDGETGMLIQPKSVDAIVNAITSFNTEKYLEMSEKVLAYYYHNFQVREVMSNVMTEFSLLIQAKEHAHETYVAMHNGSIRKENQ